MANKLTQDTLREMRRLFVAPLAPAVMIAVILVLGVSGPFGTLDAISFGPRLVYWAITVPLTYGVGAFFSIFVLELLKDRQPVWLIWGCAAMIAGVFVTLTVMGLNWFAFGQTPFQFEGRIGLTVSILATAVVIALALLYMTHFVERSAKQSDQQPMILDRLELSKRGSLISMSVQDHYVEVTTSAGASLLLLRLSDAMRETEGLDGLQIHRSHWVARAHVTAARRQADKAILTLSDGRTLPASRRYIKVLKEAGILPK